jgi:small-conductance mechanosensitive channel
MENLDQIFNPESASFWSLLLAIAVLIISFVVARLVRRKVRALLQSYEGLDQYAGVILGRIAGWTVVLLGVVLALSILGVNMAPVVLIALLIAAFVILSGRSLIENWAAGLLLQARGPFRPGDRIDSVGYSGFVEETNARSVVMRTGDGQIVHIPNAEVLGNPLVNRTGHEGRRRSSLRFGVAYGTDIGVSARLLTDAAVSIEDVHHDPAPSAWISSLGETNIQLELRFWHDYSERHLVRSAVAREALNRLEGAGVSMPFPTQELVISGTLNS